METAVRREVLRIADRAVEQRINADRSDEFDSSMRCSCGGEARYSGRRRKTFTTVLGAITLERAY